MAQREKVTVELPEMTAIENRILGHESTHDVAAGTGTAHAPDDDWPEELNRRQYPGHHSPEDARPRRR
jgi:hypothetical protein